MQFLVTFPACPDIGTTDGGTGGGDESNGCLVPLAIAARDDEVDNAKDLTKPGTGEETCDGEANTADRGSSLQSDKGCNKDEDDGCRGGWLAVAAVGSRLVLTGPPSRGAFVREELWQVGLNCAQIEGAAGRGPVPIGPPSKRAVGQILWFRVFAIVPAVVVAMSVVACVANATCHVWRVVLGGRSVLA